jgi:hypothetical protein
MKKLIGTLAIAAVGLSAFGQGQITVANGATSLVQQWADASGSSLQSVAANNGKIQFLAAPDGTAFKALGSIVAGQGFSTTYTKLADYLAANPGWNAYNVASVAPVAGRFNAGTVTVSPLTPGGKIEYTVIGWNGTSASYDAAYAANAYIGQSAMFAGVATGDPTTTPPGTPGAISGSFTGLTVAPIAGAIPEPSTFALLGLGAAAMMIFRRK